MYLRVFNQKCSGIEKISITAYGEPVSSTSDNDLYGVFAMKNRDGIDDYFAFFSNWDDSGASVGTIDSDTGTYIHAGVWITPNCTQNNSTIANLSQINDIFIVFKNFTSESWTEQRKLFGELSKWEIVSPDYETADMDLYSCGSEGNGIGVVTTHNKPLDSHNINSNNSKGDDDNDFYNKPTKPVFETQR